MAYLNLPSRDSLIAIHRILDQSMQLIIRATRESPVFLNLCVSCRDMFRQMGALHCDVEFSLESFEWPKRETRLLRSKFSFWSITVPCNFTISTNESGSNVCLTISHDCVTFYDI